jgi:MSHA pilin protein MshD
MSIDLTRRTARRSRLRGATLIETIMFMVIVGIALSAVLSVFVGTSRRSADPMIQKQALAIAESLMEEIRLQPFTFCDPDDPLVTDQTVEPPVACGITELLGFEPGENRTNPLTPFDNVNDYAGLTMPAGTVSDITGAALPNLAGYAATVAVASPAAAWNAIPATEVLFITVTVTGPNGILVVLDGVRTRYAPHL